MTSTPPLRIDQRTLDVLLTNQMGGSSTPISLATLLQNNGYANQLSDISLVLEGNKALVDFSNCEFTRVTFSGNFHQATFENASFHESHFTKADFSAAVFNHASFEHCDFSKVSFNSASYLHTSLNNSAIW